jgi:hypothetical protein
MIRTQVQIEEPIYERLRQVSTREHRSMSACVREALVAFLTRAEASPDDLSDIAGRFRPLDMEGVKEHDRVWADAIAREGPRT